MASDSGSYNDISRDAVLDTDDGRDPFVMASDSGSYNDISRDAVLDTDDRRGNEQEKTSQGIDDYKKYTERMPSELKYNIFDILLLHSEEDLSKAEAFQESIQRACKVKVEGKLRSPEVQLENEIKYVPNSPAKSLDFACKKALFIFLFVTENFCNEDLSLYKGHVCLLDALINNKWNVVPVQTEDSKTMKVKKYDLPLMLRGLNPIKYWDKNHFLRNVAKLIESKVSCYEDMALDLENQRKEYFVTNKTKLILNGQKSFVESSRKNVGPIREEGGKLNESTSKSHSDGESTMQHTSLEDYGLESNPDHQPFNKSETNDSIPRNSQFRQSVNLTPGNFEPSQGTKDSDLPRSASADLSSSSQPTSREYFDENETKPVQNLKKKIVLGLSSTQKNVGLIQGEGGNLNESGFKSHSDSESTMQHTSSGNFEPESTPDHQSFIKSATNHSTSSNLQPSQSIKDSDLPRSADLSSSSQPTSRVNPSSSLPETDRTEVTGSGAPTVHHHYHYHTHIGNIQSVEYLALRNIHNFDHTDNPDENGGSDMRINKEEKDTDSHGFVNRDASEQIRNFQKAASTNCESTPNNEQKGASTYCEPRPNAEQRAAGTNMPVNRVEPFQKMRPSDEQGALPFVSPDQMIKKEQTLPIASQDQVMNKELPLPFVSPDQMSKKEQ